MQSGNINEYNKFVKVKCGLPMSKVIPKVKTTGRGKKAKREKHELKSHQKMEQKQLTGVFCRFHEAPEMDEEMSKLWSQLSW